MNLIIANNIFKDHFNSFSYYWVKVYCMLTDIFNISV